MDIGPIEDKPVRLYRPGSQVLSIGSYGCNFRCGGCHNLDISWGVKALDELAKGQSSAAYASPAELVESAVRLEVDGIAFTYSEPAVWLEYVIEVSRLARDAGLFTVYVSNSFVTPEALEVMAPWIDVLCSDVKSFDDSFYKELCSVASVDQVLTTIEKAHQLGIHIETRTNIIPGKNNNVETYRAIASWIKNKLGADSPWHITRFFPAFKLAHLPPTSLDDLSQALEIARQVGLKNVYVYGDKGCDCAEENLPVASYLAGDEQTINQIKKCAADCCGDEGILLKKYE
jgi:pyruvate formate lyase activating enzyme